MANNTLSKIGGPPVINYCQVLPNTNTAVWITSSYTNKTMKKVTTKEITEEEILQQYGDIWYFKMPFIEPYEPCIYPLSVN